MSHIYIDLSSLLIGHVPRHSSSIWSGKRQGKPTPRFLCAWNPIRCILIAISHVQRRMIVKSHLLYRWKCINIISNRAINELGSPFAATLLWFVVDWWIMWWITFTVFFHRPKTWLIHCINHMMVSMFKLQYPSHLPNLKTQLNSTTPYPKYPPLWVRHSQNNTFWNTVEKTNLSPKEY